MTSGWAGDFALAHRRPIFRIRYMLSHARSIFELSPVPGDLKRSRSRIIVVLDDMHWMDYEGKVRWTRNLMTVLETYVTTKRGKFL